MVCCNEQSLSIIVLACILCLERCPRVANYMHLQRESACCIQHSTYLGSFSSQCCASLQYMVRSLRKLEGRVVGVVGLGHLEGMQRQWEHLDKQRQTRRVPVLPLE